MGLFDKVLLVSKTTRYTRFKNRGILMNKYIQDHYKL